MIEFLLGISALIIGIIAILFVIALFGIILIYTEELLVLSALIFWGFIAYKIGYFLLGFLC